MNANDAGYAIKRRLARGSMAEVFVASKLGAAGFEREVLLKRLLPHLAKDRAFVELFLHEARVLARLSHPHITSVVDLGQRDGAYFLVLELVDGPDLHTLMETLAKASKRLPVASAVHLVSCLLDALRYVHACSDDDGNALGLVHRDVTLSNVMLSSLGQLKLVDFGIARSSMRERTSAGVNLGHPGIHAPEIFVGEPVDGRTDVYGACIVLHQLLTGREPFDVDDTGARRKDVLSGRIRDPRELGLPAALAAIIARGLQPKRQERWPSAHAMLLELERFTTKTGERATREDIATLLREVGLVKPNAARARDANGPRGTVVEPKRATVLAEHAQAQPDVDDADFETVKMQPLAFSKVPFATKLDESREVHDVSTQALPAARTTDVSLDVDTDHAETGRADSDDIDEQSKTQRRPALVPRVTTTGTAPLPTAPPTAPPKPPKRRR